MPQIKPNGSVINVLVVDDHKMIRDGLKVMLASLSKFQLFKLVDADSGEDAIKKISKNTFCY